MIHPIPNLSSDLCETRGWPVLLTLRACPIGHGFIRDSETVAPVGHEAEFVLARTAIRHNVAEADMGTEFPIVPCAPSSRTEARSAERSLRGMLFG